MTDDNSPELSGARAELRDPTRSTFVLWMRNVDEIYAPIGAKLIEYAWLFESIHDFEDRRTGEMLIAFRGEIPESRTAEDLIEAQARILLSIPGLVDLCIGIGSDVTGIRITSRVSEPEQGEANDR